MPTEIHGLPAHVLFVHVVVVLVPLAALLVLVAALWPAARRRLGAAIPVTSFLALVSVPITTHAGEWLRAHVKDTALVDRHAELGDQLLPFVLGLFVLATAVWWLGRRHDRLERPGAGSPEQGPDEPASGSTGTGRERRPRWFTPVRTGVAALAVAVSVASVVQIYRIGDSGARAAWQGHFSRTSHGDGDASPAGG